MADKSTPAPVAVAHESGEGHPPKTRGRWRDLWQVPTFLVAGAVLVGGLSYAVKLAPKPKVGGDLKAAEAMVERGEYGVALETLNTKVLPKLTQYATPDEKRMFHLLRARSIYKGQSDLGVSRDENYENVLSEFQEAIKHHATLTGMDHWFIANSRLSLGKIEEAIEAMDQMPAEMAEQRIDMTKRVIELFLRSKPRNEYRAMDLLSRLAADPAGDDGVKLWTLARQSDILVRQGFPEEAINKALRALVGLGEASEFEELRAEVHVTLGSAYATLGDGERAIIELERAEKLLGEEHELMATVNLLRAGLERALGEEGMQQAKQRYQTIIDRFEFSRQVAGALLGLAEMNARLSVDSPELLDESKDSYGKLIKLIEDERDLGDVELPAVVLSLMSRYREQRENEELNDALVFAELAEAVSGRDAAGDEVLFALADTHKSIAERVLRESAGDSLISLATVDPATQREARRHLVLAGEYFRLHADVVVQKDTRLYGDSLWHAADAFDRAGDLDASVMAFQRFAQDFPSDTRNAESRFRLGQAFQARGDLELAAQMYRSVIEGREVEGTGSWADASLVPLAQTFLLDEDNANDEEAERLLTSVVAGSVGGTRTETFRAALNELGEYYYRVGQHERAVERFEEYLMRLEKDSTARESIATRYKLADSFRLSASAIATDLASQDRPEDEKRDLEAKRIERLKRAQAEYEQVQTLIGEIERPTAIQELYLRNASFFLADCSFDLREFDVAIRYYDAAREKYSKEPAALVAMIQIVNALVAQGQLDRAATANARAKRFYESIPETAWDDPTLPMSRSQWERWLDSQVTLGQLAKSETQDP